MAQQDDTATARLEPPISPLGPPTEPAAPDSPASAASPASPALSSDSLMNITPCTSPGDDFGVYSDSDAASHSSLQIHPSRSEELLQPPLPAARRGSASSASSAGSAGSAKSTRYTDPAYTTPGRSRSAARRDLSESTPSPMPKKRIRRKSSRADEKPARLRPGAGATAADFPAGYTLMPATGKIFRNLLILEESLREQVVQQRAIRRKYLTFLAVICAIIASILYHLFVAEYAHLSKGAARVVLQFILLALLVTLMLYHLLGEYQKTIVAPKKFLSSTNKGLRQLNVRLVRAKASVADLAIDLMRECVLHTVTGCLACLRRVGRLPRVEWFLVSCQLQCQPRVGVTDVKLVLNARVFGTDVREGWELYRSEFWAQEGVRRRQAMLASVDGARSASPPRDKRQREKRPKRRKSAGTPTRLNEANLRRHEGDELPSPRPLLLTPPPHPTIAEEALH
jgi:hypothetical protein